jgi:hypothetical protein
MKKDLVKTANILLLLVVTMLSILQTIQETAKDFYEILKNTDLMEILPAEVESTVLSIALILAPIVIYQEVQKWRNDNKMTAQQRVISGIKISLTLCSALIASSELFGFVTLSAAFTNAVPAVGLIFTSFIILNKIKEDFGKNDTNKGQKAGYIILGLIVTALATLAVIGTLSTSAALGILISAFIFNTVRKFLDTGNDMKKILQLAEAKADVKTEATQASDLEASAANVTDLATKGGTLHGLESKHNNHNVP